MHLYMLTFANGKRYIGQTVKTVEHRTNHHRNCANAGSMLPVHCAWRKHGEPVVTVLASYSSRDALNEAEVAAIAAYGVLSPAGYNLALGGADGTPKSPLVRAKMSASSKGKVASPETKAKLAAIAKARWADPEYRAKQAAGVAASFTPERRAKLSANAKRIHTGKALSEETRAKLSARVMTDEWRERQRIAQSGKVRGPHSEETKAKLSASIKASHDGKARGAAISAGRMARSPEERSAAAHKAWATKRAKGATA